jgi:hypothetical protein
LETCEKFCPMRPLETYDSFKLTLVI